MLRKGSATSHVAMLARSRGVPMIVGLQADDIAGRNVLIDAIQGLVIVDPSSTDATRVEQQCAASRTRDTAVAGFLGQPAISRNGVPVITLINVADPSELRGLIQPAATASGWFAPSCCLKAQLCRAKTHRLTSTPALSAGLVANPLHSAPLMPALTSRLPG